MQTSIMASSIQPSLTRRLFNMALEIGGDVINLTLGDPDIMPPEGVRRAACEAIMQGKTRYSANAGLLRTREAYASFFERQYGMSIDPVSNVITTVGGMEALYLSLAATVNSGDEVIIVGPYYVNYLQMINMLNAKAIVVDNLNCSESQFINCLEKSVSPKTVGIIVNSPNNPTGKILSGSLLDAIAKIATDNDLFVISDEVYSSLVYDGIQAESIVTRKGMKDRTILIDSCSKRFAMTGWRIGFAVGPKEVVSNMTKMQENIAACAPLPSQYAAVAAYSENCDYSYIQKTYQRRRDLVFSAINSIPGLKCEKPQATFYIFVDVSETGFDSERFAYELLQKKHVAVVPGIAYGKSYTNYIRIAFTLEEKILESAMARIREFCNELSNNTLYLMRVYE